MLRRATNQKTGTSDYPVAVSGRSWLTSYCLTQDQNPEETIYYQ